MIPTKILPDFEQKMEANSEKDEKELLRKKSEEWRQDMSESKEQEHQFTKHPEFGPPLFHRKMRPVHAYEKHKAEEHGARFKIISYNVLSNHNFPERATHLTDKDACHDPEYRMRRWLAEIE